MQIPSPPVVLALALHPRGCEVGAERIGLGGWGAAVDRLTISVGMIPRGEVGLTFANLDLGLAVHGERVVDRATFSAVARAAARCRLTAVRPPGKVSRST